MGVDCPDASRPKAPRKQATHRLMAVSLDYTIHDAPVHGLGLQPHLDGEDRAGGQPAMALAQLIPLPLQQDASRRGREKPLSDRPCSQAS